MKSNCTVCLLNCVEPFILKQDELTSAVNDFASGVGALVRRLRRETDSHELSLTQRAVIARLTREGSMTISELARLEGMKPQSMGATVSNLEEISMIARVPHPTDGRQMNIVLTAQGSELQSEMHQAKRTWLTEAISNLTAGEQQTLFEAGAIIQRLGER
jgi:DNA-binding MarR family transcriptional regulator